MHNPAVSVRIFLFIESKPSPSAFLGNIDVTNHSIHHLIVNPVAIANLTHFSIACHEDQYAMHAYNPSEIKQAPYNLLSSKARACARTHTHIYIAEYKKEDSSTLCYVIVTSNTTMHGHNTFVEILLFKLLNSY